MRRIATHGRRSILFVLVLIAAPQATAAPCRVDADCDDGIDCNGIETCGYDDECRSGFDLCGRLPQLVGTSVSASSFYGAAYPAEEAVDGIDHTTHSWCAARRDPAPTFSVTLPNEHPIDVIAVTNPWSANDLESARFTIEAAQGAAVFDARPSRVPRKLLGRERALTAAELA